MLNAELRSHFRAMADESDGLSPEQKTTMRQVLFWVLLVYLEINWFGSAALPLSYGAIAGALLVLLLPRTLFGRRLSFVSLHGALLVGMVLSLLRANSPAILVDFIALSVLVTLELNHPRHGLLLALAAEHSIALFASPWSQLGLMNNPAVPQVGAAALARLFAVIMLIAIVVRKHILSKLPELQPKALDTPRPSRPLTVAEWEARNPER